MGIGKIVNKILGIGGTVIDRVLPDKTQREKFKHELEIEIKKNEHDIEMAMLDDLKDARSMAVHELGEHDTKFTKNLKGSVRPIIAFFLVGNYIFYKVFDVINTWKESQTIPKFTREDFLIVLSILAFYFGSRGLEKLLNKDSK